MRGRARDLLIAGATLLVARGRPRLRRGERERLVPAAPPRPGSELAVDLLLLAGAGFAVGFVVVYALDRLPHSTQLLGACLGLSLLSIAAALIVTSKRLIVTEELEDSYPPDEHAAEQETIVQLAEESGSRLTRRRLFKVCAGAAGGSLGLALLTPALSLGPVLDMDPFYATTWRRGRRLVDEAGRPYGAT